MGVRVNIGNRRALSKKTYCAVEEPSRHEEIIKKTVLNWRSINIQKQRENVPLERKIVKDFNHKEIFEDMKAEIENLSGLSKKAFQRGKTSEAKGTRKNDSLQTRNEEIQKQREIARQQINEMKDTAGFNGNMEATQDFYRLIRGCVN